MRTRPLRCRSCVILSETTPRNAKPHLSLVEDGLILWPFPPPQTEGKNSSKDEPSCTCALVGKPLFIEILTTFWTPALTIH